MERSDAERLIKLAYGILSVYMNVGTDGQRRPAAVQIFFTLPDAAAMALMRRDSCVNFFLYEDCGDLVLTEKLYENSASPCDMIFCPLENTGIYLEILNMILSLLKPDVSALNTAVAKGAEKLAGLASPAIRALAGRLLSNNLCMTRGRITHLRCALRNIPVLINNGIYHILENTEGSNAIICAAGPSLKTQLETLKIYKDKFLIIAVGHAYPVLHKAGIEPDMIVEMDSSAHVTWDRHGLTPYVPLAAFTMISPSVAKRFNDVRFFLERDSDFKALLESCAIKADTLALSRSVLITAIDLVIRSGCRNIALIGSDLCLSASGAAHAESSVLDYGLDEGLCQVSGNDGRTLVSNSGFNGIRESLEIYLASLEKRAAVYNCTLGGALIAHSRRLDFESFCGRFGSFKKLPLMKRESADFSALKKLPVLIKSCIGLLEKLSSLCGELIMLLSGNAPKNKTDLLGKTLAEYENEFKKMLAANPPLAVLEASFAKQFDELSAQMTAAMKRTQTALSALEIISIKYRFESELFADILSDFAGTPDGSPFIFETFRKEAVSFIKKRNPEFAEWLAVTTPDISDRYLLINNFQYLPYIKKILPDGSELPLHNFSAMEASAAGELKDFLTLKSFDSSRDAMIILSPGNWVHVVEFAKLYPRSELMVIESMPELFAEIIKAALFTFFLPEDTLVAAALPELKNWKRLVHSQVRDWRRAGRRVLIFEPRGTAGLPEAVGLKSSLDFL